MSAEHEDCPTQLHFIHQALRLYKTMIKGRSSVPALAIDDLQMLFENGEIVHGHGELEIILEALVKFQSEELLDVILCTSQKSVLAPLTRGDFIFSFIWYVNSID